MRLTAKKSLGQHFLNSEKVLNTIVNSAEIVANQKILEIGPGTGIATEALLKQGATVTAVEKDSRAIAILQNKFANYLNNKQLNLVEGDILSDIKLFDSNEPYKIVANIPYYITGAVLEKFLESENKPISMILLVQKEVAERIIAKDNKESILSISVKAFGTPEIISKVPRGAFNPPPKVDSAVLAIKNIKDTFQGKEDETRLFFNILKAGFAHKRKYAIRNLESVLSEQKIKEIWLNTGLNPKIRPEEIKLETWLKIENLANNPKETSTK